MASIHTSLPPSASGSPQPLVAKASTPQAGQPAVIGQHQTISTPASSTHAAAAGAVQSALGSHLSAPTPSLPPTHPAAAVAAPPASPPPTHPAAAAPPPTHPAAATPPTHPAAATPPTHPAAAAPPTHPAAAAPPTHPAAAAPPTHPAAAAPPSHPSVPAPPPSLPPGAASPGSCPQTLGSIDTATWQKMAGRKIPGTRSATTPCGIAGQIVVNSSTKEYAWVDTKGIKHPFPHGVGPMTHSTNIFTQVIPPSLAIQNRDMVLGGAQHGQHGSKAHTDPHGSATHHNSPQSHGPHSQHGQHGSPGSSGKPCPYSQVKPPMHPGTAMAHMATMANHPSSINAAIQNLPGADDMSQSPKKQASALHVAPAHGNNSASGSPHHLPSAGPHSVGGHKGGTGFLLPHQCNLSNAISLSPSQYDAIPSGPPMTSGQLCSPLSGDGPKLVTELAELDQVMGDITDELALEVIKMAHNDEKVHHVAHKAGQHVEKQHQQLAQAAHELQHGSSSSINVEGELENAYLNQQSYYLHMVGWTILIGIMIAVVLYTLTDPGSSELGLIIMVFGGILALIVLRYLWNNISGTIIK